jgi:7-carboxy-7-deazaguanine synthase
MLVAEIYRSIQGEGFLTGTASIFIRTAGCNLRCAFCDTPYASWHPEGETLSVTEIAERIAAWDCRHVVLTGGEPMLNADLIPLCAALRQAGRHITIETAGTVYLPLDCDLMSISPKRPNSTPAPDVAPAWRLRHEQTRHAPDVIRQLIAQYPYQFKFVVGTRDDAQDVLAYLDQFPQIDRSRAMLMPLGTDVAALADVAAWLVDYCTEQGLQYCPRRQIEWFGLTRGT